MLTIGISAIPHEADDLTFLDLVTVLDGDAFE